MTKCSNMGDFNQLVDAQSVLTLSNGVNIPCLGFGTWQTPSGDVAKEVVIKALESGYRHIDTAAVYENEESVGEGIIQACEKLNIKREHIFVTSKLWNTERGYDTTLRAFDESLRKLKLDYLDLYLIHWPANARNFKDTYESINVDTWRAMIELYKQGRIKAIGISNFLPHHIKPLLDMEFTPMVNQIEFHIGFLNNHTVEFCKQNNIMLEAWAPLGTGRVLNNEALIKLAEKYQHSVAQLCIRFCLQSGLIPLPKSVNAERIEENAFVFDFQISQEDMDFIRNLGEFGESMLNPDTVTF